MVDILCYTVIGYKQEIKLRADTAILGLPLLAECPDLSGLQSWISLFLFPWPKSFYAPGYVIAQLQHDRFHELMNTYLKLISVSKRGENLTCEKQRQPGPVLCLA